MNKVFRYCSLLFVLMVAVSVSANDYVLHEGENSLTAFRSANATFTATVDGNIVVEAQEIYNVDCNGANYPMDYLPGAAYPYTCEVIGVKVGDVVSIASNYVMNTGSKVCITQLPGGVPLPVELSSYSPEMRQEFPWSSLGIISLVFNKAVILSSASLIVGDNTYNITTININGNLVGLDITAPLNQALFEGSLSKGKPFAIEIRGLADAKKRDNLYNGNGVLRMGYLAPAPQSHLVDATIGGEHLNYTTANSYRMKSYYDPEITGDGLLELTFDNDIQSVGNVMLTMGNMDLISAGKFHRSDLPYSIDENKVTIDLRGTLRSIHALFPNVVENDESGENVLMDFDTEHVTISVNNIIDINGSPVATTQAGNIGSFAFTMGYEEIADNLVMDGENISEGDAVNPGDEIKLWLSEAVAFDAINVAYEVAQEGENSNVDGYLGYVVENIIVTDFSVVSDGDNGLVVTFTMPEMPEGVDGRPVTVSLINAKSENGIPHDLIIRFVLGEKADPGDNPGGGEDNPDNPTTPGDYKLHTYTSTDGGILYSLNHNGKWAVIRLGNESAGGDAIPELYEVETEQRTPIIIGNEAFDISAVSDDGNIVVGSYHGQPASYNRSTSQLTSYPMRKNWRYGSLSSVTPDGKWAVGAYNCYTGNVTSDADVPNDYYFAPLYVNIETGDTIQTPNMPKYDQAHGNENATALRSISPDGRYIIGAMDWFYMQPAAGCVFIYDTQEQSYRMIGFTEGASRFDDWTPDVEGLHHIESAMFSPDGHLIAGDAYMARLRSDGSDFYNEYTIPYVMDMLTGEVKFFDDGESSNITVGAIDNEGTIFGNPESGGPLRNFRIFYKQQFWIPFSQICQQRYGFSFPEKSGYEYHGTVVGTTGDGSRFLAFSDPQGESYVFDFGETVEQACASIDMFAGYSVTPERGAAFSNLQTMEVNFGRSVQVVGKGNTHVHLYKADGTLVRNALSTSDGLKMKTDSRTTVQITFRPTVLEDGEHYYVTIDAGAVSVVNVPDVTNHSIRIDYVGRREGPVQLTRISPADGSQLRQFDSEASYVMMTFDSPVKLTESYEAYLERTDDGSRITSFAIASGNTEATRNQLMLIPASTTYLYKDQQYRLVLKAGSVTDRSGSAESANEEISLLYTGTYVREVTNEAVMFADDFNNPNASLGQWLMYDGDKLTPTDEMQAWGFTQKDNPWNFSTRDNLETADYFASSHSMYTGGGKSDDWMMTPQMTIPEDFNVVLDFDAQKYHRNAADHLLVYVYENDRVLSNPLNSAIADIKAGAVLLDDIDLAAGATDDNTAGEWTHYHYDLTPWAGKNIYVAFANQNDRQSAVFVDNVTIQRELLYTIGFSNLDRVVDQQEITIAGRFTVEYDKFTEGNVTMTLRDAEGTSLGFIEQHVNKTVDPSFDFSFSTPLPLTVGQETPYAIDIALADRTDTYRGSVINLAFQPVKRVVLEEMTGYTCQFCPQGIIAIEECERTYGDRFIPVSIHSYSGDRWGQGLFTPYSDALGLSGAPSARINRIEGVYSPMFSTSEDIYYDRPEEHLWYNVVAQELNRLAVCEVSLAANYSEDENYINMTADVNYALDADNQQLSLFIVLLENGLVRYQQNGLYQNSWPGLGEWGAGGRYGEYQVSPFTHNDVVRACIGQTYSGTIGLFPSAFTAGEMVSAELSAETPSSISDKENIYAVAMLIDTQSGEIINAAKTKVLKAGESGIRDVFENEDENCYDLSGRRIDRQSLGRGIYIVNGKKVMVK